MDGWMRSGWVASLALCLGLGVAACGSNATKTDSSAQSSSSPKAADSSKSAKKDDKADKKDDKADKKDDKADKKDDKADDKEAKNDKADGDKKDEVDVDSLLNDKDDAGEEAGALKVDISAAKDDAPTIGGSAPPEPKEAGAKLEWINAGTFAIPNLGMKKQEAGELLILELADKKGGVIFTPFKDEAEAKTKVEKITEAMKLKDFKWKQKPKPVTLGADKIPALLGGGHAVGADGKGGKLGYALIKGTPNVLAIMGVDDDASKEDLETVFSAVEYIKKK